jgi:hypothetical protein
MIIKDVEFDGEDYDFGVLLDENETNLLINFAIRVLIEDESISLPHDEDRYINLEELVYGEQTLN